MTPYFIFHVAVLSLLFLHFLFVTGEVGSKSKSQESTEESRKKIDESKQLCYTSFQCYVYILMN